MKISQKTLALSLLLSLCLTACSSGGKGGDAGHTTPSATHSTDKTAPQAQPMPPKTEPKTLESLTLDSGAKIAREQFQKGELKNVDIGYGTLTGYNRRYSFNGVWGEWNSQPEQLDIEGNLMELGKSKLTSYIGGLYGAALDKYLTVLHRQDNRKAVFYFGDETAVSNMPKSGRATYIGNATRFDNIASGDAKLANVGTSRLYADFDNKTISGKLDMDGGRRDITLHTAQIKGNAFEGKAVAEGNVFAWIDREGTYEGKFFGPNADEVAGKTEFSGSTLVGSVSDLNTSFSAEKVSSSK